MPTILLPSSTNNAPTSLSAIILIASDRVARMDGPYLMTLLIEDLTNCCHDGAKRGFC